MSIQVIHEDWGLVDYKVAWDKQESIFHEKAEKKLALRKNEIVNATINNHLIFCEHPHVYTLGKSGSLSNLLVSEEELKALQATYYAINRGGDITYHGPGQVVVYPILDLEQFFTDIHKYLRILEEAVIKTLHHFNIQAGRYEGFTGVWIDANNPAKARKICAMGVRCSRWITMHGLALNVNTDLSYFNHIVPCGIDDKQVTSMEKELNYQPDMEVVKSILKLNLVELFDIILT
jgi:lipoyl(octanoyl) transferase